MPTNLAKGATPAAGKINTLKKLPSIDKKESKQSPTWKSTPSSLLKGMLQLYYACPFSHVPSLSGMLTTVKNMRLHC